MPKVSLCQLWSSSSLIASCNIHFLVFNNTLEPLIPNVSTSYALPCEKLTDKDLFCSREVWQDFPLNTGDKVFKENKVGVSDIHSCGHTTFSSPSPALSCVRGSEGPQWNNVGKWIQDFLYWISLSLLSSFFPLIFTCSLGSSNNFPLFSPLFLRIYSTNPSRLISSTYKHCQILFSFSPLGLTYIHYSLYVDN